MTDDSFFQFAQTHTDVLRQIADVQKHYFKFVYFQPQTTCTSVAMLQSASFRCKSIRLDECKDEDMVHDGGKYNMTYYDILCIASVNRYRYIICIGTSDRDIELERQIASQSNTVFLTCSTNFIVLNIFSFEGYTCATEPNCYHCLLADQHFRIGNLNIDKDGNVSINAKEKQTDDSIFCDKEFVSVDPDTSKE